jgi:hypothetical protein
VWSRDKKNKMENQEKETERQKQEMPETKSKGEETNEEKVGPEYPGEGAAT